MPTDLPWFAHGRGSLKDSQHPNVRSGLSTIRVRLSKVGFWPQPIEAIGIHRLKLTGR